MADELPRPSIEAITIAAGIYTDMELVVWLQAPQPLLENWTPLQLIACGRGDDLARAMRQMEDGVYI